MDGENKISLFITRGLR